MNDLQLVLEVSERRLEEIVMLRKRAAELERVLRMYPEWVTTQMVGKCLACHQFVENGHSNNCPRQAVLNE